MSMRVLIANDHSVVRQGLKMFLALAELEVVGEADKLGPQSRTQTTLYAAQASIIRQQSA